MINYGKELKYHRIVKNKSLRDVEKDTGISSTNLSRWENGKVLHPRPSLHRWSGALLQNPV